ncbi:hypothetical protein AWC38_SpisGene18678 [Stylophora pistillata]|uniref:Uncharacterized protein n=1 Tax=Stylophora pistillata TaxID=50429 RepID=A0A2B4RKX2_STYPI|nr:hypothetical protein AWC38_SpisGene18678 [Stylophora pistillata]
MSTRGIRGGLVFAFHEFPFSLVLYTQWPTAVVVSFDVNDDDGGDVDEDDGKDDDKVVEDDTVDDVDGKLHDIAVTDDAVETVDNDNDDADDDVIDVDDNDENDADSEVKVAAVEAGADDNTVHGRSDMGDDNCSCTSLNERQKKRDTLYTRSNLFFVVGHLNDDSIILQIPEFFKVCFLVLIIPTVASPQWTDNNI